MSADRACECEIPAATFMDSDDVWRCWTCEGLAPMPEPDVETLGFAIRRADNACDSEADFIKSDWLAQREATLRSSIAAEIEAQCPAQTPCDTCIEYANVARGSAS